MAGWILYFENDTYLKVRIQPSEASYEATQTGTFQQLQLCAKALLVRNYVNQEYDCRLFSRVYCMCTFYMTWKRSLKGTLKRLVVGKRDDIVGWLAYSRKLPLLSVTMWSHCIHLELYSATILNMTTSSILEFIVLSSFQTLPRRSNLWVITCELKRPSRSHILYFKRHWNCWSLEWRSLYSCRTLSIQNYLSLLRDLSSITRNIIAVLIW